YSEIWFKYDRVIPLIDALKDIGYAEYKDGLHFPDDNVLYQSRIWASQKLIELFYKFHFQEINYVKKLPPKEIIQLREMRRSGGSLMDYKETNKTETMRYNLIRYNKFIEKQDIEVSLPPEVPVNWHFLETRKGNILSQRIEITKLATDNDLEIVLDDQRFEGYRIDGMTFIITDKAGINAAEKILNKIKSNINNIQYSTYNEYYIHHINYLLQIYHNTTQYPSLTPIPMTQSFYADHQENQTVDTQMTTTVEEYSEKKPLADYGIRQLNFRSNFQHLHRVFIWDFYWGGRFYGAVHIDLPKEVRQHITINGSPTVELDYSAHHVRMLYNWEKIPYDKDPYEELCQNKDERPIYKKVVLISLNAGNEKVATQAISNELREDGYRGDCLKHDFIGDCLNKFKEHHKPIANYLHQGYGIELQYADSRIAEQILYQMVGKAIPALPVHDSFIVPEEHEETLREVMIESYQKIMGKEFLPMVK
ncbi:MAG: hypothetical protein KJ939_07605, partial [Nanoarchaeota archaeon]|nr:hypothetical protein [Nanoarchaeota archaeon]